MKKAAKWPPTSLKPTKTCVALVSGSSDGPAHNTSHRYPVSLGRRVGVNDTRKRALVRVSRHVRIVPEVTWSPQPLRLRAILGRGHGGRRITPPDRLLRSARRHSAG